MRGERARIEGYNLPRKRISIAKIDRGILDFGPMGGEALIYVAGFARLLKPGFCIGQKIRPVKLM
jgi:hypothetical protein